MARNLGLERIMHKLDWSSVSNLIQSEKIGEIYKELNDVGVVFEKIHMSAGKNLKQEELLSHLEFVIIKSVANYFRIKYQIEAKLKYPDEQFQKYFEEITPLSIEDLLTRCNSILDKNLKLIR